MQVIEEIKALSKKNPAGFNAVLKETSFEPAEGIDSENIGSEDDLGVFWDDATEGDPKPEELLWAGLEVRQGCSVCYSIRSINFGADTDGLALQSGNKGKERRSVVRPSRNKHHSFMPSKALNRVFFVGNGEV